MIVMDKKSEEVMLLRNGDGDLIFKKWCIKTSTLNWDCGSERNHNITIGGV